MEPVEPARPSRAFSLCRYSQNLNLNVKASRKKLRHVGGKGTNKKPKSYNVEPVVEPVVPVKPVRPKPGGAFSLCGHSQTTKASHQKLRYVVVKGTNKKPQKL